MNKFSLSYILGQHPYSFTLPPLGSGEAMGEKAMDFFGRGLLTGSVVGFLHAVTLPDSLHKSPRFLHAGKVMARGGLWSAVIWSAASLTTSLYSRYHGSYAPHSYGVGGIVAGAGYSLMFGFRNSIFVFGTAVVAASAYSIAAGDFWFGPRFSYVKVSTDYSTLPPPNDLPARHLAYYERKRWSGRLASNFVSEHA